MIHRYPISSILSLKFHKQPKLCDNHSHLTRKHGRVFLQHEVQRITKLLPIAGKHPDTSQIPDATAFVQRNARESLQFANLSRDPLNIYAHVYFVERGEIPFTREEVKQMSACRTKPEKFRCSFKPQHKKPTMFQSWNLHPAHLREPDSRPRLGASSTTQQTSFNPGVSRASRNANSLLFTNRGDTGISEIKFDRLRCFQWFNDLVCSLINVFLKELSSKVAQFRARTRTGQKMAPLHSPKPNTPNNFRNSPVTLEWQTPRLPGLGQKGP